MKKSINIIIILLFNFLYFSTYAQQKVQKLSNSKKVIMALRDSLIVDYRVYNRLIGYSSNGFHFIHETVDTMVKPFKYVVHDTCISFEAQPHFYHLDSFYKALYNPLELSEIRLLMDLYREFTVQDSFIWNIVDIIGCNNIREQDQGWKTKSSLSQLLSYQILNYIFENDKRKLYQYLTWKMEIIKNPNYSQSNISILDPELIDYKSKVGKIFSEKELNTIINVINLNNVFSILSEQIAEDIKAFKIVSKISDTTETHAGLHTKEFIYKILLLTYNNIATQKISDAIFLKCNIIKLHYPELFWEIIAHTNDSRFFVFLDSVYNKNNNFQELEVAIVKCNKDKINNSRFIFNYLENKISTNLLEDNNEENIFNYIRLLSYSKDISIFKFYQIIFPKVKSQKIRNLICVNYVNLWKEIKCNSNRDSFCKKCEKLLIAEKNKELSRE